MGAKKAPFYRIVAIDERKARDGQYLESIGTYDPAKESATVKSDRALYWLGVGAQPTETVRALLKKQEIIK